MHPIKGPIKEVDANGTLHVYMAVAVWHLSGSHPRRNDGKHAHWKCCAAMHVTDDLANNHILLFLSTNSIAVYFGLSANNDDDAESASKIKGCIKMQIEQAPNCAQFLFFGGQKETYWGVPKKICTPRATLKVP